MKKTRGFLLAAAVAAMALTFSCSSDDDGGDNVVVGSTCSADFGAVQIGTQTWAAKNLNCAVEGSKCYNNDPANCTTYGRLYNWATAMALPSNCNSSTCPGQINNPHRGICPSGWHIPSDADWNVLMETVGGSSTAGIKLKATSGWNSYNGASGNGEDTHGFYALPGGYGISNGSFQYVGIRGYWWSASEYDAAEAYQRYMIYNYEDAYWHYSDKSSLFSVRCIKN